MLPPPPKKYKKICLQAGRAWPCQCPSLPLAPLWRRGGAADLSGSMQALQIQALNQAVRLKTHQLLKMQKVKLLEIVNWIVKIAESASARKIKEIK